MRLSHAFAFATFVAVVAPGCGSDESDPPATEIAPNVFVVPDDIAKLAKVEPERLTFPLPQADSLRGRAPDDILVAGFGDGFLRRVRKIDVVGDSLVIDAPQAALTDAIVRGELDEELVPTQEDLHPDIEATGTKTLPTLGANLDGKVLFQDDHATLALSKAHVELHPSIGFGFKISGGKVESMRVVANGDIVAEAALRATLQGAYTKSDTTTVWKTTLRFVQVVGFVPVVEIVTISVDATWGVEASGKIVGEAGASFERSGSFGVTYANGEFATAGDAGAPKVKGIGPTVDGQAKATVRVGLVPRAEVKLYGVAGPALVFDPHATFTLDVTGHADAQGCDLKMPYDLEAGVSGRAELDASVFGHSLLNVQRTLFDEKYPIASGDFVTLLGDKNPCAASGGGGGIVVPGCKGVDFRGRTFSFCKTAADATQARAICTKGGTDLAIVHDAEENAFVQKNVTALGPADAGQGQLAGYYIGLQYDAAAKSFHWVDGTPASYFDWAKNEPTHVYEGVAENCAMTFLDGTWNDVPCTGYPKNAFVCESK